MNKNHTLLDEMSRQHIFEKKKIFTSNSVQLFRTSVNLRVSIHVIGIMNMGKTFNKNK